MQWLKRLINAIFHLNPTPNPAPPDPVPPQPVPVPPGPDDIPQALINAHNQYRSKNPLKLNPLLQKAAQEHANYMAEKQAMAHQNIGDGTPSDRMTHDGYNYSYAGENIAMGQIDVQQVMQAWMNSPAHRANILNMNYEDIGAAVAHDLHNRPYWCVDFARQTNELNLSEGYISIGPDNPVQGIFGILKGPWIHERDIQ